MVPRICSTLTRDHDLQFCRVAVHRLAVCEIPGQVRFDLIEPRRHLLHQILQFQPLAQPLDSAVTGGGSGGS